MGLHLLYTVNFPSQFIPSCNHPALHGCNRQIRDEIGDFVPRKFQLSLQDESQVKWTNCPGNVRTIEKLEITILDEGATKVKWWAGRDPRANWDRRRLNTQETPLVFIVDRVLNLGIKSIGPEPKVPKPILVKQLTIKPRIHGCSCSTSSKTTNDHSSRQARLEHIISRGAEDTLRDAVAMVSYHGKQIGSLEMVSILWPDGSSEKMEDNDDDKLAKNYDPVNFDHTMVRWKREAEQEQSSGKGKNAQLQAESKTPRLPYPIKRRLDVKVGKQDPNPPPTEKSSSLYVLL